MPTYTIGFSRKTHVLARLIIWFTRPGKLITLPPGKPTDLSHTYIRRMAKGVDDVFESVRGGNHIIPRSVFLKHEAVVKAEHWINLDEGTLDRAWAKVTHDRVGLRYSVLQILGDAYVMTRWRLTGKRVSNPFSQALMDVCSELALIFLREANAPHMDGFDESTVYPLEMYARVLEHTDVYPENPDALPI